MLMDSDPVWVDMKPAIECVDGLEDHMILHSGPNLPEDATMLHSAWSAVLFEVGRRDEEEAVKRLKAGEIKISSALDHNTVGAGTGIITKSVVLNVVEDRHNYTVAATFPAEGPFQGGFCGWGLYSGRRTCATYARRLFRMVEALHKLGGIPIKPILAESMQMGDENHTRQTACDYIYDRLMLPALFELDRPKKEIMKTVRYIVDTPRFFHCYGQAAARAALVAADGTEYSTMVTAVCGNGVEFGIKIASLPGQWFTAPAPMMKGRYTSSEFTEKDQLPWMGDSCVVECYGMGGFAAAASPIVCNLRGMTLKESIGQTKEMYRITMEKNYNFPIPNLDFDFLPVGIDIRKVLKEGVCPAIHGGMFNRVGGLIGAGMARVPMQCFEKALVAFGEKYL